MFGELVVVENRKGSKKFEKKREEKEKEIKFLEF